jgi:succinate dehydrogenase/fumarate reductase flavoprotein subunit
LAAAPLRQKRPSMVLMSQSSRRPKPERSGNAAGGMDEIGIFPRDGISTLDAVRLFVSGSFGHTRGGTGRFFDPNVYYRIFDNSLWALEELEKLDVTMSYIDGEYGWMPWGSMIDAKVGLKVHWQNVKPELAAAVRKRSVNILERTMIVDLLTNKDRVVGATAVNTRTGEFHVIKARAVIIASGSFKRHYNHITPLSWKYKMRYDACPASSSGDGLAVAYRAGADLACMEMMRAGLDSRDDLCMRGGNFFINDGLVAKLFTWKGKEIVRPQGPIDYLKLEQKGLDPLYQSFEHFPDDFLKRLEIHFADERLIGFKVAEDRGFNPKTHRYQVVRNRPASAFKGTGINVDEEFSSSLKGVFAVGECSNGVGIGCAGSATGGFLVGDNIHRYINKAKEPGLNENQVEGQRNIALAPLGVRDGVEPMELECTTRYICEEYAGMVKSEGQLREGLRRLMSLKRVFLPKLMAENPHYLMRCLEVRNIMDMAELHFKASLERKETRGQHIRLDYP